jgi:putative phosphoesterase
VRHEICGKDLPEELQHGAALILSDKGVEQGNRLRSRGRRMTSIGVISDTHGLLRESALDALQGCQLIVHAGDVGSSEVLSGLGRIAPVTAVKGNVDTGEWASTLPAMAAVEAGGVRMYVLHQLAELDIDPAPAGFQFVIFGHSHRASCIERGGVRYLNPGSAGPRRFKLPLTLARIEVRRGGSSVQFVTL